MNRSTMRAIALIKLNETSSNTSFSSTNLNYFLDEAWEHIYTYNNIKWDWLMKRSYITNPYTTVSASSTGTTLKVTANTNIVAGNYLYVISGNVYEEVSVSNAATTTLTLTSPGLTNTYTSGTVSGHVLALPTDLGQIVEIKAIKINSSDMDIGELKPVNIENLFDEIPFQSSSIPDRYAKLGSKIYLYPIPDAIYTYQLLYLPIPYGLGGSAGTDDTYVCELPTCYQNLIVDYALYLAFKSDKANQNSATLAQDYRQSFELGFQNLIANNTFSPNKKFRMTREDEDLPSFK